jgi:hypothetical protein
MSETALNELLRLTLAMLIALFTRDLLRVAWSAGRQIFVQWRTLRRFKQTGHCEVCMTYVRQWGSPLFAPHEQRPPECWLCRKPKGTGPGTEGLTRTESPLSLESMTSSH